MASNRATAATLASCTSAETVAVACGVQVAQHVGEQRAGDAAAAYVGTHRAAGRSPAAGAAGRAGGGRAARRATIASTCRAHRRARIPTPGWRAIPSSPVRSGSVGTTYSHSRRSAGRSRPARHCAVSSWSASSTRVCSGRGSAASMAAARRSKVDACQASMLTKSGRRAGASCGRGRRRSRPRARASAARRRGRLRRLDVVWCMDSSGCLSGVLVRRSRQPLRQSPDRDDEGSSPHRDFGHGCHLLGSVTVGSRKPGRLAVASTGLGQCSVGR